MGEPCLTLKRQKEAGEALRKYIHLDPESPIGATVLSMHFISQLAPDIHGKLPSHIHSEIWNLVDPLVRDHGIPGKPSRVSPIKVHLKDPNIFPHHLQYPIELEAWLGL